MQYEHIHLLDGVLAQRGSHKKKGGGERFLYFRKVVAVVGESGRMVVKWVSDGTLNGHGHFLFVGPPRGQPTSPSSDRNGQIAESLGDVQIT